MNINRRGAVLIFSFIVVMALTIMSVGFIARVMSESNTARRYVDSVDAFWVAEAGVSRALNELGIDFNVSGTNLWSGSLSQGDYSVDVEILGDDKKITSHGFVPSAVSSRAERIVEAIASRSIPSDFFDKAIYSAGDIDFNGSSYSVEGDVLYADDIEVDHPENITGTTEYDPDASPLARFDFLGLFALSSTQGNVYDEDRLDDVKHGSDSFPDSFWFSEPSDPGDPTTGTPNIVYITSDLQLNGNIGNIGGFYVVVGDVITDPEETENMTINGNGEIDGVIYTRGEFRVNGGGGGLNVDGGVWAGEEVRLNGNAHVAFNADFMAAIDALDLEGGVQIVSWRDTQNPYSISAE